MACAACGKTTQLPVPWARPGSGFTAAFEALALALCRELPVRQAAALLRCTDKQLWLRIEFYVDQARALEDFSGVQIAGIDETSMREADEHEAYRLGADGYVCKPVGFEEFRATIARIEGAWLKARGGPHRRPPR